jgi:hypothetical protein
MVEDTKQKGDRLEKRVVNLYKKLGKWNVKHDVTLVDKFGNRSQIDVVYGLFFKKYIECKNYSGSVPLEMVAKFKEVLTLNGIPLRRGIFITTSTYTPRATTIGIRTIDGTQLRHLERGALWINISRKLFWLGALGFVGYSAYVHQDRLKKLNSLEEWKKVPKEVQKQSVYYQKQAKRSWQQWKKWAYEQWDKIKP